MAKKMKTKTEEIRKLSDADLSKELDEAYRRMFSIRLQKETLQLKNHRQLPVVRRQVARLRTIQRQRQLARAAAGRGGAR